MLKGIVSGSPVDITRIAMKGKNLAYGRIEGVNIGANGQIIRFTDYDVAIARVENGVEYTANSYVFAFYTDEPVFASISYNGTRIVATRPPITFTAPITGYVAFRIESGQPAMLNLGSQALPDEPYGMQPGWEVRDQQGTILWGADKTLTGTDSISFKGYGLPLKSYEIEANMEQAASQQYSITGTDSVTYQSDGTAIALQIVGNETQTGTPTPTVPITPQEFGDKTANLFDKTAMDTTNGYVSNSYIRNSGEISSNTGYNISEYIAVTPETNYTIVHGGATTPRAICWYDSDKQYISGSNFSGESTTVSIPANGRYVRFSILKSAISEIMLVNGETAPASYIPYGYAIDISCGGTTQTVYLTEPLRKIGDYADSVASDGTVTRRIRKVTLDGTETMYSVGGNAPYRVAGMYGLKTPSLAETLWICSHYRAVPSNASWSSYPNLVSWQTGDGSSLRFRDTSCANLDAFKAYLASQYAAGTPVCVWYVLATPVSDTATFPTITPTQGSNTLSVNTTLAPSAITLTATSGVWPGNPIQPQEFGERTENLFDYTVPYGSYIQQDGTVVGTASILLAIKSYFPQEAVGKQVTLSIKATNVQQTRLYIQAKISGNAVESNSIYSGNTGTMLVTVTPSSTSDYFIVTYGSGGDSNVVLSDFMLNLGSTALPYEPYGKYKIPITNAGTTYNIFLTEPLRGIGSYADTVESIGVVTRQIYKWTLTGSEPWYYNSSNAFFYLIEVNPGYLKSDGAVTCLCTHYKSHIQTGAGSNLSNNEIALGYAISPTTQRLYIKDTRFTSKNDFTAYLAQQYSSGTPVEVWYVLAESTTETITAPEIATTAGTNTLTVDTTLIPSSTEITLHAKPIRFGFKIDKTNDNSDTAVTYTYDAVTMTPAAMNFTTGEFNYGSWENVWFVKDAYPVALNLDGTEAYKLNPDDYTKKEDGTDSDIQFVLLTEAPSDWSTQWKQYYTKDANDNYELNSQSSVPTFAQNTYYKLTYNSSFTGNFMMAFPKVYFKRTEDATYNYVEVSDKKLGDDWYAYAHINTSGQEVDFIYLPLFKGVIVDSKLRSIPGQIPQGNTTATDEVNAATALGSRWQIWDHSSVELINDLLTLMSKSIDSQGRYGQGRSSGYDSTDTVTYGKLQTGTLVKKGKFYGYSATTKEVKVFGIEGFWANRLDRLQGMLLVDNVWKIKMTPPYNFTGTDFVTLSTAEVPSGNGYLSRVQTSEYGSIPASIANGSSTKYFKDPFFKSATNTRVALRGGSCTDGGNAGFRYINVDSAASISYWAVGASPVYK